MDNILNKIIANKRREVALQKEAVTLKQMLSFGTGRMERSVQSMRSSLEKSASGVIAEFKRKSPSKGWLHPQADVKRIVPAYEKNGAAACSILTDTDFFGGCFRDLQTARQEVSLPLLRKDFIVDEYQLFQARILGADAILLIATVLSKQECIQLAQKAHELGMEVLLEIHNAEELERMNPHIDMLGVNNRNLGTFDTCVDTSFQLVESMQKEVGVGNKAPLLISESGLSDAKTIRQLRKAGFQGFLIGETFMKAEDPGEALKNFIAAINNC